MERCRVPRFPRHGASSRQAEFSLSISWFAPASRSCLSRELLLRIRRTGGEKNRDGGTTIENLALATLLLGRPSLSSVVKHLHRQRSYLRSRTTTMTNVVLVARQLPRNFCPSVFCSLSLSRRNFVRCCEFGTTRRRVRVERRSRNIICI